MERSVRNFGRTIQGGDGTVTLEVEKRTLEGREIPGRACRASKALGTLDRCGSVGGRNGASCGGDMAFVCSCSARRCPSCRRVPRRAKRGRVRRHLPGERRFRRKC